MSQGYSVDVFEISANRQSSRQPGHPHPQASKHLLDIGGGHFPLHRRIRRKNNFPDTIFADATHQLVHAQRFRSYARQRIEASSKDVISPAKSSRPVHNANRRGFFHDTDHRRIAAGVEAELTALRLGRRPADPAGPDPFRYLGERCRKAGRLFRGLLQQVVRQSLSGLAPDSRQPGKFGNQIFNRRHRSERQTEGKWLDLFHFCLENLLGSALGICDGGHDQIGEKLGITLSKDHRVNRD